MKKKIPGHTVMWPGIFYVGDEPKSGPALNLGGRLQSGNASLGASGN